MKLMEWMQQSKEMESMNGAAKAIPKWFYFNSNVYSPMLAWRCHSFLFSFMCCVCLEMEWIGGHSAIVVWRHCRFASQTIKWRWLYGWPPIIHSAGLVYLLDQFNLYFRKPNKRNCICWMKRKQRKQINDGWRSGQMEQCCWIKFKNGFDGCWFRQFNVLPIQAWMAKTWIVGYMLVQPSISHSFIILFHFNNCSMSGLLAFVSRSGMNAMRQHNQPIAKTKQACFCLLLIGHATTQPTLNKKIKYKNNIHCFIIEVLLHLITVINRKPMIGMVAEWNFILWNWIENEMKQNKWTPAKFTELINWIADWMQPIANWQSNEAMKWPMEWNQPHYIPAFVWLLLHS